MARATVVVRAKREKVFVDSVDIIESDEAEATVKLLRKPFRLTKPTGPPPLPIGEKKRIRKVTFLTRLLILILKIRINNFKTVT